MSEDDRWVSEDNVFVLMANENVYTLFDEPESEQVNDTFWVGDRDNLKDLHSLLGKVLALDVEDQFDDEEDGNDQADA